MRGCRHRRSVFCPLFFRHPFAAHQVCELQEDAAVQHYRFREMLEFCVRARRKAENCPGSQRRDKCGKRRTNCKRAGLSKRRWNAKSLHLTALETTYARTRRQEPLYSTKEGLVSRMEKGKRMEIKNPSNGPTSAALGLINLIGYLTLTLFE